MRDVIEMRGHTFFALGRAPIVFDLGANDGRFAAELTAEYPDATLVLVEADPLLVGELAKRFRERPGVALFRGLVGATSRDAVEFHLSQVPEGNSVYRALSDHWAPGATRAVTVPMIGLPELIARVAPPRIDLLKVDIEGSEWDVLPTLTAREAALISQITVEFHDFVAPAERQRTEACIAHLARLGYAVRARSADHEHGSPYFDCLFFRD